MFYKLLDRIEEIFVGVLMMGMTLMITLQIIFRYIILKPISWSEEAARYMMVWAIYVGAALAVKRGKHMVVDFFVSRVSPKQRKIVIILSDLIFITFCLIMLKQGFVVIGHLIRLGQVSAALGLPMYYVYLAPIISFVLICVHLVVHIYQTITEKVE